MQVAVIGGGAAGFFAAISCKHHHPKATVIIYEKSDKVLAKVKVSGGGRCNVTNACFQQAQLLKNYPRGNKQLKKAFAQFTTTDTVKWFESRGVKLKTEPDNRMFPVSNNSQSIIDCLVSEATKLGVVVKKKFPINSIEVSDNHFLLSKNIKADNVIVTTGGSPKPEGFAWLTTLGHLVVNPVPSLFTFNMPGEPIRELMGTVAENAVVKIQGTKLQQEGPLLVTHWGMSGPVILKLSAWGARLLSEMNYAFSIQVNWVNGDNEDTVRAIVYNYTDAHPKKKITNQNPFGLTGRLWEFLLNKAGIATETTWSVLNKKSKNRLINTLTNDVYEVKGKTTFKEEFVTCGGISLAEVDFNTMQSKKIPGLYFAGEVLDVDAVTGGFNFQAAWTTGYIAGQLK